MALSKTVLGALLKTKIVAIKGGAAANDQELTDMCNAIADAIVTHIQAAATITGSGTVTSGAGSGGSVNVTTGAVL